MTDRSAFAIMPSMDTKEVLIQASLKVFAANGYHGSSIADIAREAKVSKALFYHYFESKNELLVLFAKQRLEEWTPLVENLETIEDPKERVTFLIDLALDELETVIEWTTFELGWNLIHSILGRRGLSTSALARPAHYP